MIEDILEELEDTWALTTEELDHIRECLLKYASAAMHDSEIAEEVFNEYDA